uniref:Uncharacterized protein n=1 Tax=Glossina palpalis gambiensis TaxID=67801 RepID=A0A1B0B3S4_9MUSC
MNHASDMNIITAKRFLKKFDYKIYIICDRDHLDARKTIKAVEVGLMLLKPFLPMFSIVKKKRFSIS